MQIAGTVVSVTLSKPIAKRGGQGTYEGWELVYKDINSGEVKTLAKPSQSLTQVPGLKDSLSALAENDPFVANLEKEGAFWAIKALAKGELATPLPSRTAWKAGNSAASRDFETKEERALRQKLIVRQSSISTAILFAKEIKGKTEEQVFELADKVEAWVWKDL